MRGGTSTSPSCTFAACATTRLRYAIQRLLTDDELVMLTLPERNVYEAWLHGRDVKSLFRSRSSVHKYVGSIERKTGINILSHRRPERLPAVDLTELFRPCNVLPVPAWAHGTAVLRTAARLSQPATSQRQFADCHWRYKEKTMTVRLCRWGNSTGLRLPAALLQAAGLAAGHCVSIRLLDNGDIRVRPVGPACPAESTEPAATTTRHCRVGR